MKALEVRGITKEFGGLTALRDVSFSVDQGTITALIGPNGAGKTTVLNILSGFLKPEKGEAYFKHHRITGLPPFKIARLGIARTFQNTRLFLQITVLENVLLAMRYQLGEQLKDVIFRHPQVAQEDRAKRDQALAYLALVGLEGKRDELAENLSYGQRKLLELARALATGAELFLLDEPLAGVFPETRRKIIEVMQRMRAEGKTIVFIEHLVGVVSQLSDRVVVLKHGEKIADGEPTQVLNDQRVLEAYLGEQECC